MTGVTQRWELDRGRLASVPHNRGRPASVPYDLGISAAQVWRKKLVARSYPLSTMQPIFMDANPHVRMPTGRVSTPFTLDLASLPVGP